MALIVQRCAEAANLDSTRFVRHSLRAGLAAAAALTDADLDSIMRQIRHKSVEVARTSIRRADLFRDNVTARVL